MLVTIVLDYDESYLGKQNMKPHYDKTWSRLCRWPQ